MAKVKIDIGLGSYKTIDEISTTEKLSPIFINGYLDHLGNSVKRMGYAEVHDFGNGINNSIDGLWYSERLDLVFIVYLGNVYKLDENEVVTEITGSVAMQIGKKVSFQDDGVRILMANGGQIQYYDGSGVCTVIGSSPYATKVGFIDQYAMASDDEWVYYSTQGDSLTWNPSVDNFAAESRNDFNLTTEFGFREVTIFGSETIDVYYDEGGVWTRLDGGFVDDGLGAKDTVGKIDNTFIYLSNDKRIKKLINRVPVITSTPWDSQIQTFDITGAYADVISIVGKDFYILTFPEENVTIVYDAMANEWYQWGYWNQVSNDIEAFRMKYHAHATKRNKHYIGDSYQDKVHNLNTLSYSDDDDAIRFIRRTGNISHDTLENKICNSLKIRIKSDIAAETTEPVMGIRWKNDGEDWMPEQTIALGTAGKLEKVVELYKLGMYQTRQYEFIHAEKTLFILHNPIEADVEALV